MLEIRKSYPSDAYALINIRDIVWKSEFYDFLPSGINNEMAKNLDKRVKHLMDQIAENNRILVALEDGIPVGYVFYAKAQNVVYDASAEIRDIYVLPEFQRKGIGKMLFQKALEELRKLGYSSFVLYCPLESDSDLFFLKMNGVRKEIVTRDISGYSVVHNLFYFELFNSNNSVSNEWNDIYLMAQEHLHLLNNINREVAVISTFSGNMYLGLGIKNKVCPIESALSNMYLGGDNKVSKILIVNRESKPVLPCGRCRDLLINLGQDKALILFDYGTLKTMTMKELNPYYKDEEKV